MSESESNSARDQPTKIAPGSSSRSSPDGTVQNTMEFATIPIQPYGNSGRFPSPYDMRALGTALPGYTHTHYGTTPPGAYSQAQQLDFTSSSHSPFGNQIPNVYNAPQQGQFSVDYPRGHAHSMGSSGPARAAQSSSIHPYQQQQFLQRPSYLNIPQATSYITHSEGQYHPPGMPQQVPQSGMYQSQPTQYPSSMRQSPQGRSSSRSPSQTASAIRGPPRKPRQSGHALWVGNLPPGTQILDLKDHFSREATDDIESVFLISKSNCAFINYKTEASCTSAMHRFHDSRFGGVRLVCRLRRGSNTSTTSTKLVQQSETLPNAAQSQSSSTEVLEDETKETSADGPRPSEHRVKEKYFVIKSLTIDDLERSVTTGIWATQAHNETMLNAAFEAAENVYLVFSANKSGEYFGYARMETAISSDSAPVALPEAANIETPSPLASTPTDIPRTITTPATETAPKGRIIDDSARGTIFWEADSRSRTIAASPNESAQENEDLPVNEQGTASPTTFGKPFSISWQSTERLPFYRTRGLRNPWNANREVKIARDGTEIEPSVGRKLITMFEQQAHINAAQRAIPQFGYSNQAQFAQSSPGPSYGYALHGHGYGPFH